MAKRLATVIHWFFILLGSGWAVVVYSTASQDTLNKPSTWWAMLIGAAILGGIGWIIDYVLTGRTSMVPSGD